jgi:hypothetical protein
MADTWDHSGQICDAMLAHGATLEQVDEWDEYDLEINQGRYDAMIERGR